jgi:sulfite exporter TauE/SafE
MNYILLFIAGVLSSMHCIGMCGCFVTAYSMNLKGSNAQKAISHLLYSFGRITTYTFLGALMGFLGSSLYFLGKMAGVQNLITLIAGIIMIYLGLSLAGFLPKIGFLDKTGAYFLKYTQGFFSKLMKKQGILFTYPLGVTLGFLPCCLLYTVELQAMTTGSPLKGALSMFAFGLGTIPSLFSFGMLINIINHKTKEKLLNYASYVIIILGISSVYRAVFT